MTPQTPQPQQASKMPETQATPGAEPLPNHRQEAFANLLAKGNPIAASYAKAGFKPSAGNATRLGKDERVQARVLFLKEQIAAATVYDTAWIKGRLARHAEVLTELTVDPETGEKKPGPLFNAHAGARALELLGKEAGLFKDKIELGGKVQVENTTLLRKLTPEERASMREMLRAAAEREALGEEPGEAEEPGEPIEGVVRPAANK